MSTRVYVMGVGMTPFGRQPDETVRSLATRATDTALRDAGLTTGDIELVVFANAAQGVLTGQEMIRGQAAFHGYGFNGVAILNVENACASASTAFQVAANAVASGAVDVALAVGSEVLTHEDKSRTMATFSCAVDLEAMSGMREQVERSLLHRVPGVDGSQQSALMDLYAETARRFLERGGATIRDAAQVAVKNRAHAALNPLAQFHAPDHRRTGADEQDDRRSADPLHVRSGRRRSGCRGAVLGRARSINGFRGDRGGLGVGAPLGWGRGHRDPWSGAPSGDGGV